MIEANTNSAAGARYGDDSSRRAAEGGISRGGLCPYDFTAAPTRLVTLNVDNRAALHRGQVWPPDTGRPQTGRIIAPGRAG